MNPKHPPGQPMTLGNMREQGVRNAVWMVTYAVHRQRVAGEVATGAWITSVAAPIGAQIYHQVQRLPHAHAMARWSVYLLRKGAKYLGTVMAKTETEAIQVAAKQFRIEFALRNKIVVTKIADND